MYDNRPNILNWIHFFTLNLVIFSTATNLKAEPTNTERNTSHIFYIEPNISADPQNITSSFLLTIEFKNQDDLDDCFSSLIKYYKAELEKRFRITQRSYNTSIKNGKFGEKYQYQLQPETTGEFLIEGPTCGTFAIRNLALNVTEVPNYSFEHFFESKLGSLTQSEVSPYESIDFSFYIFPKKELAIKHLAITDEMFTNNNPQANFQLITKDVEVKADHYKLSGSLVPLVSGLINHDLFSVSVDSYGDTPRIVNEDEFGSAMAPIGAKVKGPRLKFSVTPSESRAPGEISDLRYKAFNGDSDAASRLSIRLIEIDRDFEALYWLERYSSQRPKIMIQLGHMYYLGQGTKPSCSAALNWYRKAAKLGSTEAEQEVTRFFDGKRCIGRNSDAEFR
jgi:hypothetical protein